MANNKQAAASKGSKKLQSENEKLKTMQETERKAQGLTEICMFLLFLAVIIFDTVNSINSLNVMALLWAYLAAINFVRYRTTGGKTPLIIMICSVIGALLFGGYYVMAAIS